MYIALEGIKGSGKSTLLNGVYKTLSQMGDISFTKFGITAPMPIHHPMERALVRRSDDAFMEKLFLQRAYYNYPTSTEELIIGDRSIATAIVTRWDKWNDPLFTINRVKYQYGMLRKPEIIVFMNTPIEVSINQIQQRKNKLTGKSDEAPDKLKKQQEVYGELFEDKYYLRHLGGMQYIRLDYCESAETLQNEFISIIKYYKK